MAFRVARKIVNLHNGDNNCDIGTNGELLVARAALPHCGVVFDVGANVGEWTNLALTINPNATYHCFEPSQPTFAVLSRRSFPANAHRNPFGLGERTEERKLFVYAEGRGSNSLYYRNGLEEKQEFEEVISLRTLDDYSATQNIDSIDFMKIDVEGHELAVLRGASRMLAAGRIGVIQFEYGGCYIDARVLLKDIWEHVLSLNSSYSFYKIYPDGPRPIARYEQALETFQYSNWLITRSDWASRVRN
ncbi:MAG TPA: FkbM family methyltransferase [Thermoanaerobaculia bacterium]|nr:FkbM family methyltransferase [Thermoanaerobaculia bacterium]